MRGELQSPELARFFHRGSHPWEGMLCAEDLVAIDLLYRAKPVWSSLRGRLATLEERGVVERVGRGRGVRYLLSQRFYAEIGNAGAYTRTKGLDRETNKALLLRHITGNGAEGGRLNELIEVLRNQSRDQVQHMLRELKREGRIWFKGTTKGGRWLPRQGGPRP